MTIGERVFVPFRIVRPIAQNGETVAGQTILNNMRGNLWLAEHDSCSQDGQPRHAKLEMIVCDDGLEATPVKNVLDEIKVTT